MACPCTADVFGRAVKGQFPPSSAVFLSFILPGAAEPPRTEKEAGGSPDTSGAGVGNNPWFSLDPQQGCGGTPWLVCPLCCPSRLIPGHGSGDRRVPSRTRRSRSVSRPSPCKGRVWRRWGARWLRSSVPSSPRPGTSAPAPRPPRVGALGGTEPQPLGVRGKRQELNSH